MPLVVAWRRRGSRPPSRPGVAPYVSVHPHEPTGKAHATAARWRPKGLRRAVRGAACRDVRARGSNLSAGLGTGRRVRAQLARLDEGRDGAQVLGAAGALAARHPPSLAAERVTLTALSGGAGRGLNQPADRSVCRDALRCGEATERVGLDERQSARYNRRVASQGGLLMVRPQPREGGANEPMARGSQVAARLTGPISTLDLLHPCLWQSKRRTDGILTGRPRPGLTRATSGAGSTGQAGDWQRPREVDTRAGRS